MSGGRRSHRIVENERLFEAANQAVRGVKDRLGVDDSTEQYRCECSFEDCTQRIALTRTEYEEMRESPDRYVVLAAHRDPVHEQIVGTTERYVLVEQRS